MEVLNMEVKLLVFVLVLVLQNIHTVSAETSGKNSFSCFIIFGHTHSALLLHQYSVFRFISKSPNVDGDNSEGLFVATERRAIV